MTPNDLLQHVDVLRVLFGVAILITYINPSAARVSKRWFWFAIIMLLVIALAGLAPWVIDPRLSSWVSFGSLFQAIFNVAVGGVLVLRYFLYNRTHIRIQT